jgi:hypothetical protein
MEHRNSRELVARSSREMAAPRPSREMASPAPRKTMGTRRTAMRVMHRTSSGINAVYEQDPTAADAGRRTLVFETPTSCTRIVDFPTEWQRLSDDDLAALRRRQSYRDRSYLTCPPTIV